MRAAMYDDAHAGKQAHLMSGKGFLPKVNTGMLVRIASRPQHRQDQAASTEHKGTAYLRKNPAVLGQYCVLVFSLLQTLLWQLKRCLIQMSGDTSIFDTRPQ